MQRQNNTMAHMWISDPVKPGILERGVLLPLRFIMDHHVNLRPVRLYPGVEGPLAGKNTFGTVSIATSWCGCW